MLFRSRNSIRRFLLHVLPPRFHRIRHFGLLAGPRRRRNLDLCRRLLRMPPPSAPDAQSENDADPADALWPCPAPQTGTMLVVERFEPGAPPSPDASS